MKKQEALKYIKEQVGFVPIAITFDIYNDEDEIPQELIEAQCGYLKEPPKPFILYTSAKGEEMLKNAIREEYSRRIQYRY